MPKTSVLSVRIDKETREILERHAELLQMKPTTLAARVLKDCTEEWVRKYVKRVYSEVFDAELENGD